MIPVEPHNVFCDLAEEGAALGLLGLMTGISEEYWCAGWMSGLEFSLWQAAQSGPMSYGQGHITERQATLLRLLSEESDGWWRWIDDTRDASKSGARFVRLDDWRAHLEKIRA